MSNYFHIVWMPLLPALWLVALGALAAAITAFALYGRARGSLIRIALCALILLTLANPSLVAEKREPLKDTALLVIDDSASMKLGDRAAQTSKAADAIAAKLAALPDLDVETLHVTGEDETDLFHAIERKRSQLPADRLAGIIALTDGQVHDKPAADPSAPFHALIAGKKGEIDRRLIVKSAPAYGIVGKKATVTIRVEDTPEAQGKSANVTIIRDDGSRHVLVAPVGEDVEVETMIAHGGANVLAFEAETVPNELTDINNVAAVSINGIRDRLRVLLVSGIPHAGARDWRNLLKADPAVDLVHFTILRSPLKDNSVPNKELALIAFPSQEIFDTKLGNFDLVIFDGFTSKLLIPDIYLANIASYVRNGGALLISNATGAQAAELSQSPLARILPATSSGTLLTGSFVPDLTESGRRHPVTAALEQNMPRNLWSPWYRQVDARLDANEGEVLMSGMNGKPLLVLARVGQGRVAQFLSNQFWLWSRQYPNGGPEAELVRRTAHWLVGEPELDETSLHARAEKIGDDWRINIDKRSLQDTTANAVVTGPNNQPVQVKLTAEQPGNLHGEIVVKQPGLYHVKDSSHEALVMVGHPDAPEFGAMAATEKVLQPIAKSSSGTVMWLADHPDGPEIRRTGKDAAQSGWGWIGLKRNSQYRITGSSVTPLWPAWAVLALLLIAAMGAWHREGR